MVCHVVYTYMPSDGWWLLNFISTIGALLMGIGFLFLVASIVYAHIKAPREATGDNWDGLGRTLEWSTSAIPLNTTLQSLQIGMTTILLLI